MTILPCLTVIAGVCVAQGASSGEALTKPPTDAVTQPSGLVSKVLVEGKGEKHPDGNDIVQAHYIGRSADGKVFLSTYERGQPGTFPLDKVFPGWSEGMQLMVSGEKRRLWIPKRLGPKNPQQGPDGDVIFDVELLGFLNVPDPPASFAKPAEKARLLPSGASVLRAEAGEGEDFPAPDDVAILHYISWDASGKNLDSTYARNRPVGIPLDKVLPAFAEAVSDMVVGEHRFIWMPQQVHDGQWPKAPNGPMALRVELVRLMPASSMKNPEMPDVPKQDAGQG